MFAKAECSLDRSHFRVISTLVNQNDTVAYCCLKKKSINLYYERYCAKHVKSHLIVTFTERNENLCRLYLNCDKASLCFIHNPIC